MLQSLKQLYGKNLGASDGDIGQIKDFYFDDQTWAVRYVVADTGKWLPGRQVLLPPHAFSNLNASKAVSVNLTRKQIEDSPSTETHKPVSRQYEEEYYLHFGLPFYWEGGGLWGGMRGFPVLVAPRDVLPNKSRAADPMPENPDAELHSSQAVSGYHINATDGIVGHVHDFLMEDTTWAISQLVIKTGHRFTGKEVQIPVSQVERISYKESTVHVKLGKETVEKSPEHRLIPNEAALSTQPAFIL